MKAGVPLAYKCATSGHIYTYPIHGDIFYSWEANADSYVPTVTLSTSYDRVIVGKAQFTGTIAVIYGNGNVFTDNRLSSTGTPFSKTASFPNAYLAHVGICIPTSGLKLFGDNTNHTTCRLFNGVTTHITNINSSTYPNGVTINNAMIIRVSSSYTSSKADFAMRSTYERDTSGIVGVKIQKDNVACKKFYVEGDSNYVYYAISGITSYVANDIRMTSSDITVAVGNGFGVDFSQSCSIGICACYMSAMPGVWT